MTVVGVHEAKTHLSQLLRRVAEGEEIEIHSNGRPVARPVPVSPPGKRQLGYDKGKVVVPDDFDAPLPPDIQAFFETRVLIDTQVFLWMQTDPARLGSTTDLLEDPETVVYLSAASSWEISIKCSVGKLPLPESPITYNPDRMRRARVNGLPVQHRHATAVADLPLRHRDPFDRLLIAQAQLEDLLRVTADPQFRDYQVNLSWVD